MASLLYPVQTDSEESTTGTPTAIGSAKTSISSLTETKSQSGTHRLLGDSSSTAAVTYVLILGFYTMIEYL